MKTVARMRDERLMLRFDEDVDHEAFEKAVSGRNRAADVWLVVETVLLVAILAGWVLTEGGRI